MKELVLTNDAKRVLLALYKEYKRRKKAKQKESDARYFGDEDEVQPLLFPNDEPQDIGDVCWDLSRKGLLNVLPGDDKANCISFTSDGIAYMESRMIRAIERGIGLFSKLKP